MEFLPDGTPTATYKTCDKIWELKFFKGSLVQEWYLRQNINNVPQMVVKSNAGDSWLADANGVPGVQNWSADGKNVLQGFHFSGFVPTKASEVIDLDPVLADTTVGKLVVIFYHFLGNL